MCACCKHIGRRYPPPTSRRLPVGTCTCTVFQGYGLHHRWGGSSTLNPEEKCKAAEYVRTLGTEGVPVDIDTLMMVAVHVCSLTWPIGEQPTITRS